MNHSSDEISAEKRWILQLYRDFDDICFQHKLKLSKPIIRIEELSSIWGDYNSSLNTIRLSKRLFVSFPWQAVLAILRHEMAHQVSFEYFSVEDGHGEYFKKSCALIGIDTYASVSEEELIRALLKSDKNEDLDTDEASIIRKTEKLLALASSSNEHEAVAAMAKVRELYKKYNIEKIRSAGPSDYYCRTLRLGKKRVERYQSKICSILINHFFVDAVFSREYCPEAGVELKTIEILGLKQNVLMAEYVFEFLCRSVNSLWLEFKKSQNARGAIAKNSYILGLLDGFNRKLENENRAKSTQTDQVQASSNDGLIRLASEQLSSYVSFKFPRLTKRNTRGMSYDPSVFASGVKHGQKIHIYKTIETTRQSGKLLSGKV